jgi:hypothetical protein
MKLNNCPYCQSNDSGIEREVGSTPHYYVACYCCEARGPVGARTEELAVELYNTRKDD